MASNVVFMTGKAEWCKFVEPDKEYQYYGLDLAPNDEGWETFKESGLQLQPTDRNNDKWIRLRRPVSKLIKGEVVEFGAPKVLHPDGETEWNFDTDGLIGNGSTVTCKVVVYDSKKGKGHRLEAVRVDEHIKYEGRTGDAENSPF